MVSVRILFVLVLVAMLVVSEAAPQRFNRFRGNRRRGGGNRFRPNRFNNFRPNRFLSNFGGGGFNNNNNGGSNTQANANVVQGTQGNQQVTNVNANVVNTQQNNPNGFGLSGGLALASNLQFNSPFGNINLSNTQAQTVNQQQSFPGFVSRRG